MQFSRASVVDFILRDRDLGKDPLQIQLWHDNSGKGENVAELPKSIDKRYLVMLIFANLLVVRD